jgi:hypothetical protein
MKYCNSKNNTGAKFCRGKVHGAYYQDIPSENGIQINQIKMLII